MSLGMPEQAVRNLELAATLAKGAPSLSIGSRPDVHSRAWAAHARWLLGHADDALSSCADAIRLGREIEHSYSLAVALAYGAITHQMRRDMAELGDTVGELRELCDRYEFAYYREWGLVLDGWSRADESGIALARLGIGNLPATTARAVYNAMIDKRPAAIARCRDVADVIACVRFGGQHGVEIAIRAAATTQPGSASGTAPSSSTSRCCAAPRPTRRITTSAMTPAAPGETSITRPSRSAWPLPPAFSRPLAWPA